jgi:hypothetical protein
MEHALHTADKSSSRSRGRASANGPAITRRPEPAGAGVFPSRPHSCACGGSCPRCQAKSTLTIGAPDDAYEREADSVADRVMRMPADDATVSPAVSSVQRKCDACEKDDEEKLLQPKRECSGPATSGAAAPAGVHDVLRSSGRPLAPDTRSFFETRFGRDFSRVRVHADAAAGRSAREVSAAAYTVGRDIVFGHGRFAPDTAAGQRLLAHELTHVVQQSSPSARSSRVQRTCADGNCESCAGGRKDFWVTVFFRRRATQDTMTKLRTEINGAKAILANCCLNIKFDFNWTLLPGGGSLPAFEGDPLGEWHYTPDEQDLGEGTTFSGARGIPMLLVDDVPLSGGGVTVDPRFDTTYTGRDYFAIGINQTTTPNLACNHIAHELWHVASGLSAHDPANGAVTSCSGAGVSPAYCDPLRALV